MFKVSSKNSYASHLLLIIQYHLVINEFVSMDQILLYDENNFEFLMMHFIMMSFHSFYDSIDHVQKMPQIERDLYLWFLLMALSFVTHVL